MGAVPSLHLTYRSLKPIYCLLRNITLSFSGYYINCDLLSSRWANLNIDSLNHLYSFSVMNLSNLNPVANILTTANYRLAISSFSIYGTKHHKQSHQNNQPKYVLYVFLHFYVSPSIFYPQTWTRNRSITVSNILLVF